MGADVIRVHIAGIPELRAALKRDAGMAPALLDAAGRGVSNLVIRHLRARNARPSRPGWPKSEYWATAARSVKTDVAGHKAVVSIYAPGILLRLHGGIVRPKAGKKALAIPMRPEVADVWPSEYDPKKLFLIARKALGKAWLAQREKNGHITILWRLVRQTRHKADPTVLPTDAALGDAALSAARDGLRGFAAAGGTAT
jgi:hypothetical protein